MFDSLHDYIAVAVAALLLWGVIHPRLPTGVLGTIGMGMMMVGILYSLDTFRDPIVALDIVISGIGVVGVCLAIRVYRRPHRGLMRRVEDWYARSAAPETMPPELRDAIVGGAGEPPRDYER